MSALERLRTGVVTGTSTSAVLQYIAPNRDASKLIFRLSSTWHCGYRLEQGTRYWAHQVRKSPLASPSRVDCGLPTDLAHNFTHFNIGCRTVVERTLRRCCGTGMPQRRGAARVAGGREGWAREGSLCRYIDFCQPRSRPPRATQCDPGARAVHRGKHVVRNEWDRLACSM